MNNQDSDIPKHPLPPAECPLTTLVGKRVTEMTDAELEAYTREMRTVIDSPQEFRKKVTFSTTETKKSKPNKPQINLNSLLGL